jgi:predicted nucleic acid-binding protein
MRVLIDSSAWIDFFRGCFAPDTERLRALIADGEDLCLCGHVLAEVLRGTRHDEQYRKVERSFQVLAFLPMTASTFRASADIYRHLRKSGITLKNSVDTFIAATAIEHDVYLLHDDSDFDLIAREFPLKIFDKT